MRYVISIPPFAAAPELVDIAVDAEAAGWDAVVVWDHLQWIRATGLDVHDPWVLLGAIAARTERVILGPLVTPLSRRRPWIVAKHLTTLDHLSNGRALLGVGLGAGDDFGAFGDEEGGRARAALLDEGLDLLSRLLSGDDVVHDGPHFHVDARLLPPPVQRPRPRVWVAAVAPNRRPLRRAVQWDGVVPIGPDELLTPEALAAYLDGVERPRGWDVVAPAAPGVPVGEYADAGATWLMASDWPTGDWLPTFRAAVRAGPPR